jgi:hypothetical protein
MRKVFVGPTVLCLTLSAIVAPSSTGFAADTHVIVATQQLTWTHNGKTSTPDAPLVVDDLKVGDIIDISIPEGRVHHGFVTTSNGAESRGLVLACGDDKKSKPNAVLQEINCGPASKFGVMFTGDMQLNVLDTFKDETDFWCVVHTDAMTGALKLKQ